MQELEEEKKKTSQNRLLESSIEQEKIKTKRLEKEKIELEQAFRQDRERCIVLLQQEIQNHITKYDELEQELENMGARLRQSLKDKNCIHERMQGLEGELQRIWIVETLIRGILSESLCKCCANQKHEFEEWQLQFTLRLAHMDCRDLFNQFSLVFHPDKTISKEWDSTLKGRYQSFFVSIQFLKEKKSDR